MTYETLLQIEQFSSEEEEQHRITSAKEIEFVLLNMAEKGTRVALYYGASSDSLITTILAVDKTGFWLEGSQNDADNLRIAHSKRLVFVASPQQVKIQFSASHISMSEVDGQPAFFMPLPESIFRLQRREYFRLTPPSSEKLICIIPIAAKPDEPPQQPREMDIMDISAGGIGLICPKDDSTTAPGLVYPECKINLPDVGTIVVTVEVKSLAALTTATGLSIKRAGCEFKNLSGASAILLQRYVTNLQRARVRT